MLKTCILRQGYPTSKCNEEWRAHPASSTGATPLSVPHHVAQVLTFGFPTILCCMVSWHQGLCSAAPCSILGQGQEIKPQEGRGALRPWLLQLNNRRSGSQVGATNQALAGTYSLWVTSWKALF